MPEHFCKRPKCLYANCVCSALCCIYRQTVSVVPYAAYIDILVQITYAKFKNDRAKDNRYNGCTKMENNIKKILRTISKSVFNCVVLQ